MQRLYLIRHAKSSWADPGLDDFHRPLNPRGQKAVARMGERLVTAGIVPELIVASPALRTKSTALALAGAVGVDPQAIRYDQGLYLGSEAYYYRVLEASFTRINSLFLVGHNDTISRVASHLAGKNLGNIPTCGIVALDFPAPGFTVAPGAARLLFYWYPKDGDGTTDRG